MLRRISTAVVASAAMVGLCALPAAAAPAAAHSATHNFTIPSVSSAVKAWGSYTIINSDRVKVTICAQATKSDSSFAVGAEAIGYSSSGKQEGLPFGAVILPQSARKDCNSSYLLFVAHLKVHSFLGGSAGRITKTSAVKKIF
jgi:hypothetical protein